VVVAVEEMALSGATPLKDIRRLAWIAGTPLAAAPDLHVAGGADGSGNGGSGGDGDSGLAGEGTNAAADAVGTDHFDVNEAGAASGAAETARHASEGSAVHESEGEAGLSGSAGLAAVWQGAAGCEGVEQCSEDSLEVTLGPMEIRTFAVRLHDSKRQDAVANA